jgi:hypothetical protein
MSGRNKNCNVMIQDGKQAAVADYWLDEQTKELDRKARVKTNYARNNYFMRHEQVECQLFRGDKKFPRTVVMTMSEMGKKNRELVMSYLHKTKKKGEKSTLWTWKPANVQDFLANKWDKVYGRR